MSKNYKKKKEKIETEVEKLDGLNKKELYELNKKKKEAVKEKKKKKVAKKKSNKKTYQTNLAGRIFAVIMLILMIGSVVASVAAYIQ